MESRYIERDGVKYYANGHTKGIVHTNSDASNVVLETKLNNLDASFSTLQNTFTAEIQNLTVADPSSAEIVAARGGKATLGAKITEIDSQLADKAKQTDLVVERNRITNLATLSAGSTTGDAELIDGRIGADSIVYPNIGDAVRKATVDSFTYEEISLSKQIGYVYNGSLPLVANSAGSSAIIPVSAGDVYRIKTTTYGGSQYAYAFFNGTTLVQNFAKGDISAYIQRDETIIIPSGVDTLIVSGHSWNFYPYNVYKRISNNSKIKSDVSMLKDNSYKFEAIDVTLQIGKFSYLGSLNLTTNAGYTSCIVPVISGEYYKLSTTTYGGSNYAYSLYDDSGNCEGNYLLGTVSTATTLFTEFEIPSGVTQLVISFSSNYIDSFILKKRVDNFVEEIEENIQSYHRVYPQVESGVYYANGITRTVDANMRTADFSVIAGEKYHYIGGTYGGNMYTYSLYKDNTFIAGKLLGTASTLVPRDISFTIPSGCNRIIICWAGNYDNVVKFEKLVTADEHNSFMEKSIRNPLNGKKMATFGDSITADDYCGIGTKVNALLGTTLVGNFAVGGATCADAENGSDIDLDSNNSSQIGTSDVNVLSNQVRRLLRHTAALGSQITWTHPTDGVFSIDASYGTGLGNTSAIPDIIYIAISTNDGGTRTGTVIDDTETVFEQPYSVLTRKSIASALRWAIETLHSAYPNVIIFIATPLWTGSSYDFASRTSNMLKRDIIIKTAGFCGVRVIDSMHESGFTKLVASNCSDDAKIHPDMPWRYNIAKYVTNEINNRYTPIGTTIYEE